MEPLLRQEQPSEFCAHGNRHEACPICKNEEIDSVQEAVRILDRLGLHWDDFQDKRVLDLGAGEGWVLEEAKRRGLNVIAFDIHAPPTERKTIAQNDARFIIGDAHHIPLQENSMDLVISHAGPPTSFQGIEETEKNVATVIKEVMRVVKPGGVFRFGPTKHGFHYITREALGVTDEIPMDEFHARRRAASLKFLKHLNIGAVHEVLSPGSDGYYVIEKPATTQETIPQ